METLGIFGSIVVILFLFVLAVLWLILPFVVFGIKSRLDTLITKEGNLEAALAVANHELKKMNQYIAKLTIQG